MAFFEKRPLGSGYELTILFECCISSPHPESYDRRPDPISCSFPRSSIFESVPPGCDHALSPTKMRAHPQNQTAPVPQAIRSCRVGHAYDLTRCVMKPGHYPPFTVQARLNRPTPLTIDEFDSSALTALIVRLPRAFSVSHYLPVNGRLCCDHSLSTYSSRHDREWRRRV
jgi:hypothetical protein